MKYLLTFLAICLFQIVPVRAALSLRGYLFVYFTGNDRADESIHFAISTDGLHYRALNNNKPVIGSDSISLTGGVRDPHILRAEDGQTFYMVATDMISANGWDSNRGMVLLKSRDLINWQHTTINVQKRFKGQENLKRVWAPQTIYDREAKRYMIYWSMKHGDGPDIIYYAYANDDFTDLATEPRQLFIPSDKLSCIDADIVLRGNTYHLFYKTEGHGNGIKVATTQSLTADAWEEEPDYKQATSMAVEGSGVFKLIGSNNYILMYDLYMNGGYQFTTSRDLKHFTALPDKAVSLDFSPRHGTVITLTLEEMQRLLAQWPLAQQSQTR